MDGNHHFHPFKTALEIGGSRYESCEINYTFFSPTATWFQFNPSSPWLFSMGILLPSISKGMKYTSFSRKLIFETSILGEKVILLPTSKSLDDVSESVVSLIKYPNPHVSKWGLTLVNISCPGKNHQTFQVPKMEESSPV